MFTAAETAYLKSQFLGRLATRRSDGTLQNSPVGFRVNDDGTIDVGGRRLRQTAKWRNVVDNGEVAFVVDDLASVRPWSPRGVEVRGHAEPLEGQEPVMAGMTSQVIRVRPRWIFSWGLGESGGPRRLG
ncbi:MAG TPA: PPOX class F420-dependent oxidoreductase [Dermatophilaceae bacterium]|jgi:pyridoxamine 5'-phosphate oxidase family protein|nr:PPOX class F420-dependent oxidoreductase [Dermatophilaceae bacterium]